MKKKNLIVSFCVTIGLFVMYRLFTDFIYLTNDDMYLQAIVSGELSGNPDSHMIYSSYFLGMILSGLYRINAKISWYGLYLVSVCIACFWTILFRCLSRTTQVRTYVGVILSFVLFSSAFFRHVAMLQYTVVAALAGATAVFYALTINMEEQEKLQREYLVVLVLASMSLLIREKVFFMMIPFAVCGWLGKCLLQRKKAECGKLIVIILAAVMLVSGGGRLAYRITAHACEWQEFFRYNQAREQIYDYYGFPDYDSNEEFYLSLEIDKQAYESASRYYMLLPQKQFHAGNMQKIAEQSGKIKEENILQNIKRVAVELVQCNMAYTDRPLNLMVYAVWICAILLLLCTKSRAVLLQLIMIFVARMGVWGFILYQGRYPERITQSLYLVELLMLIAVFIQNVELLHVNQWSKRKKMWLTAGLVVLFTPVMYVAVLKNNAVRGEVAGKLFWGTSYQQVKEYCAGNKENVYLIDMNSTALFFESVFKPAHGVNGVCTNLLPMGSWPVKSPLITENLARYEITDVREDLLDNDKVYFIFKDSEVTPNEYLQEYYNTYSEEQKIKLVRTDSIATDVGINYGIYQLQTIEY